jgi:rhodanese-related sulfurtransferase
MEFFLTFIVPIIIGVTVGLVLMAIKDYYTAKITGLDRESFQQNMRKGQLIDMRPAKTTKHGKIKGARHFKIGQLTNKNQTKVRKDLPVYLYHQSVFKAKRAARRLSLNGFADVYYLKTPFKNE